jgi:hypothetical protein
LLSGSRTGLAWIRDNPPLATAAMAGRAYAEESLRLQNLTLSMTQGTELFMGAWFAPCSFTRLAVCTGGYVDFLLGAENPLEKLDVKIIQEISTWAGCGPSAPRSISEAKEILKYIAESGKDIFESTEPGEARTLQPFMTKLVIYIALLMIPENLVGLGCLFELILGLLVSRILVRVIFERFLAVSLLDLFPRSLLSYTENFVIIAF